MQEWVKKIKWALDSCTEISNPTKNAVLAHLLNLLEDNKDKVAVIRCKDCLHKRKRTQRRMWYCDIHEMYTTDDDYCSFAERE